MYNTGMELIMLALTTFVAFCSALRNIIPLRSICNNTTCNNHGHCYLAGSPEKIVPRCVCNVLYLGPSCTVLDIRHVQLVASSNILIASWSTPPFVKDNAFIYFRPSRGEIERKIITMRGFDTAAVVGELKGNGETYRVCIDTAEATKLAMEKQGIEELHNCVDFSSHPNYDCIFAWVLIAGCLLSSVCLIYWQKDKVELLYFYRPPFRDNCYNYNVAELIEAEKKRKQSSVINPAVADTRAPVYDEMDEINCSDSSEDKIGHRLNDKHQSLSFTTEDIDCIGKCFC